MPSSSSEKLWETIYVKGKDYSGKLKKVVLELYLMFI
jgi:hypothetical protein